MKIATFNANSIRSRAEIIVNWLAENEPDVLSVQETKVQDKDFPSRCFCQDWLQFCVQGRKKL